MASKRKYRLPIHLRNKMGRGFERTFNNIREPYENLVQAKLETCGDIFFYNSRKSVDRTQCMTDFIQWQPCIDKNRPLVKTEGYRSEYDTFVKYAYVVKPALYDKCDVHGSYQETQVGNVCLLECKEVMSEEVCALLPKQIQRLLIDNKSEFWSYYDENKHYTYSFVIRDIHVDEDGVKCSLLIQLDRDYMKSVQKAIIAAGDDIEDLVIAKDEIYKMKRHMFEFLKAVRHIITPLIRKYETAYAKTWAIQQPEWDGSNAKKSFKDLA